MIGSFESMVRTCPGRVCFTFVDEAGSEERFTYRDMRLTAARLAYQLQGMGMQRGDYLSLDLPNCPAFVYFVLAAAYGAFTVVALNNRLTSAEKIARILELERHRDVRVTCRVDEQQAARLLERVRSDLAGERRTDAATGPTGRGGRASFNLSGFSQRTASQTNGGRARRVIMGAQQDAEEEAIHFAERSSHLFDEDARALIMFTSGTIGKPKAVPLTWRQLVGAASSSNASLNEYGAGLWQAALPLYHIGGFQVLVRSFLNRCPFVLYRRFDARRVLQDARTHGATHVSVVDKMLQDMIAVDEKGVLKDYRCILLGGGALNRKTLAHALQAEARLYASYGMTETASQIAHAQVTRGFDGGLRLLPGYTARVVDANEEGFGRLAVRGPGVFTGYLNARAAFTVDGYFLTGDTAALRGNRLFVKERTADMFVSGGENVYPAEIVDKLLRVPGVADAHVFGVPDATWGRRPVAFVEREAKRASTPADAASARAMTASGSQGAQASGATGAVASAVAGAAGATGAVAAGAASGVATGVASISSPSSSGPSRAVANSGPIWEKGGPQQFAAAVRTSLDQRLSKLYLPRHICVVDELPRTSVGKVDRAAVERLYEQRIEVKRVALHHVRLPFVSPFKTAKATLRYRDLVVVEVTDYRGRTGLGECVSFSTDWYLPETLEQDAAALQHVLAPKVIGEVYLHPREASTSFAQTPEAAAFPMACGAIEPALWDLYGKIVGKPLWCLLGEEAARLSGDAMRRRLPEKGSRAKVAAGAVIGLGTPVETVEAVRRCVAAGYQRVKLKVAPGGALARVRAVREAFPHVMITLDANQSFAERDMNELRALDAFGIAWIEEPLDVRQSLSLSRHNAFARLAQLQRTLSTPICLDESFVRADDAYRALEYSELRCFAVKIGKFGGVSPALDFVRAACSRGATVWMGGMYETGISKRLHAAFQTLPEVGAPGDIGATSRLFTVDVAEPPHTVERGFVTLNREGYEGGLGCRLCRETLSNVLVKSIIIE